MNITDEKIEQLLTSQKWLEPGEDFTSNVMVMIDAERARELAPQTSKRLYERILTAIPIVVIFGLLLQNARLIGNIAADTLQTAGTWLGTHTGMALFAAYPILLLGLAAPLLVGAVASCALSSQCRITRTISS